MKQKYDGNSMNAIPVEDVLVTHVGNLAKDAQWRNRIVGASTSDWLKWLVGRVKPGGNGQSEPAMRLRSPTAGLTGSRKTEAHSELCERETEMDKRIEI